MNSFSSTIVIALLCVHVASCTGELMPSSGAGDSSSCPGDFCSDTFVAGVLQFASGSYGVSEAAGSVILSVNRTIGVTDAVSIDYSTVAGTAVSGVDFQISGGTLNWADGDTTPKNITVAVIDNMLGDGARQLTVLLSNPQGGATLGTVDEATIIVQDDESASSIINSIGGIISQGETVTIAGSGLGTKAQAAPWVWDDFENGTEGALLDTSPSVPWSPYTGGGGSFPTYAAEGAYAGSFGAAKTAAWEATWLNYGVTGLDSEVMYLSWYFKWTVDDGALSGGLIMKNTRANSTPSYYTGRPSLWVTMYEDGTVYSNITPCADLGGTQLNNLTTHTPGDWHRWEVYWKLSTPGGNDGFVRYFHNNAEVGAGHFANVMTRGSECSTQRIDNFLLPMMHDVRATSAVVTYRADNVYVDRSLVRIEIADTATWSARTHAEVQIPVQWTETNITFTVNQGRFAPGESAYLYLLDEQGEPRNESGYAVSFAL